MKIRLVIPLLLIGFLAQSQQLETVVQRGHNAAIKAVTYSKDGKYLFTGSRDKTIKLWEIATGRELRSFYGHGSTINDLAVSPDGRHILSSSADKTAKLWDIKTGDLLQTFVGHKELLTSVSFHPDGKSIITAGYDNEAILWDVSSGEQLKIFKVNPDKGLGYGINTTFSPDGKYIVIGNDNRTASIYDFESGEQKFEIKPEEGWCGGCATFVSVDKASNKMLKATKGPGMQLFDINSGDKLIDYMTFDDDISSVDINKDGHALMSSEDSIYVFDQRGMLIFKNVKDHSLPITDASFSPDGKYIVTSSDDMSVAILDAKNGSTIKRIEGYLKQVDKGGLDYDPNSRWDYYIKRYTDLKNDFAISPDGNYLVKGKIGSIARMWEMRTGMITQEFRGHEKAVLCMAFSKDGSKLLTGSADNTIKVWDTSTGQELATLESHRELVFSVRFNESQDKIISGSWDGTVRVWDANDYSQLQFLTLEKGSSYDTHFFNDDIYALSAGLDKSLRLWELDSKQAVREFTGHTDIIHSVAKHPYTSEVASVSWDGWLKIWDVASGLQLKKYHRHEGAVYGVAYNATGTEIATGGADRNIVIADLATGKTKAILEGHTGAVTTVKYVPAQNLLVSASDNGEVIIWNLETNQEMVSYLVLNEQDWMAINKEGYFNATDGATRSIAFVKGMESYAAEQFFDQYYQPDLLNKTFLNQDDKLNINQKIEQFPPPEIEILAPHKAEKVRSNKVDVLASVQDAGGGINMLKVVHNGKTVLLEQAEVNNKRATINHPVDLVPGNNTIEVSAFSTGGIESQKHSVDLQLEGKVNSTLYVFAVGINKYKNEALNLNYAAADAQSVVKTISERSKKLFDRVETISLFDTEASRENILSKLNALSKIIKPQDVMVFYYAGHGSMVDGKFYFIPTENVRLYNADKLEKNAIYAGELQEKLKSIAALKQLLIIDACQSGGSVELLATRGAREEKALAQLSRSTGIHVLAAAGSEQFAVEFEDLGHGLFTYVLLEALNGAADGAPKDGKVTIYELKSFIDDQVPEYSRKYKGKMQFPYTFSRGHDFPVVID